jgi:tripartite-type tricarboxylate transporter receptor subunit TctC
LFTRRKLAACVLAATLAPAAVLAQAQDFPARAITLVAPFPAGSVTDAVTRALAQALESSLGQPVVVENRAGAQGTVGAAYVARSKPDGYTLLMASSVMFVARSLYKTLPYDPVDSFQPVTGVGSTAMMFMVPDASPIRNVADLAKAAKQDKPVTIGFGSPSGQIALALFSTVTRTSPVPVSYRGIPQALTDLAGGHVNVAIVDIGSGLAQMNASRMRPIAISAASRYRGAPEVPTLQEAFPGASGSLETIIAVVAPAGTPPPVVDKLDKAIRAAMDKTEVKARFQVLNTSVLTLPTRDLDKRIRTDNPRWEALIKKAGIEQQ